MATAVQLRRGTTTQNNAFTGALGEVSVDTTLDTIRVHDGSTQGGFEITSNAAAQTLTNKTLTAPTLTGTAVMATLDISGDVDVDGTLETDALTIGGVTLAETISDTVGAMVGSNTETGITVTYQDGDNTLDFALGAAQTTVNSILATDLIIGEDAQTAIDFGTADEIDFKVANAVRLTMTAGAIIPATNNQIDLGTSSLEFKDAYFDGTVTTDGLTVSAQTYPITVGGGGASTLLGLTDTDLTPTMDTGSLLYWNGDKWVADNTPHTLGIQDSNTLINVATPNVQNVILFEEGEGLDISYGANTVTFDIDLDWSSSYVDATQASSVWDAQGTDTHINAVLQAKGTGATSAQVPDGTTVGGNLRGGHATDFQKLRSDANQVASGVGSIILGGSCNRAYGNHSTVLGGQENTAGGTFSTVLGGYQSCVGSTGTYSTALGNRAQVNAFGSFLFRDGSGTTPYTLTDNNTAAFIADKFYVEGTHEVSGSSFSSVGTPDSTATSPTTVSVTIDADDHNFFELSLGTNTTHTVGIANGQPGQTLVIKTVQPSSGTVGLVSWSGTSNIKQAFDADNNVTALNDAEDIFTLVSFGSDWYLNGIKRFS